MFILLATLTSSINSVFCRMTNIKKKITDITSSGKIKIPILILLAG